MEEYPKEIHQEKLLYDVNNLNKNIVNDYCPHLFDHFLNKLFTSKKILITGDYKIV